MLILCMGRNLLCHNILILLGGGVTQGYCCIALYLMCEELHYVSIWLLQWIANGFLSFHSALSHHAHFGHSGRATSMTLLSQCCLQAVVHAYADADAWCILQTTLSAHFSKVLVNKLCMLLCKDSLSLDKKNKRDTVRTSKSSSW